MAFLLQHCNRWKYINFCVPFDILRSLEAAEGFAAVGGYRMLPDAPESKFEPELCEPDRSPVQSSHRGMKRTLGTVQGSGGEIVL